MSDNDITVYSYRRCPFAIRVRMTLHEKGVSFVTREENLKNMSEQLKTMHPEAKVPVLVFGDQVLYESAIITEFIEDQFPQNPLMPKGSIERAEIRLWTYWCNQQFKPDVDRFKYGTSRFPESECEGAKERVLGHLKKLEDRLTRSVWLVGEAFSLADIHVFPFFRQLSRMNPAPEFLDQFPVTQKWLETIVARPTFEATMAKPVL